MLLLTPGEGYFDGSGISSIRTVDFGSVKEHSANS
jgi:hypothetical protein